MRMQLVKTNSGSKYHVNTAAKREDGANTPGSLGTTESRHRHGSLAAATSAGLVRFQTVGHYCAITERKSRGTNRTCPPTRRRGKQTTAEIGWNVVHYT